MKPPISNETRLCASIAGSANKLSPLLHNAAYEELGLDFVFLAFGVSDLRGAIAGVRALNIRGLAVSMPHKQEVMRYLDRVDPVASRIGAVNTIVNEGGALTGYNSDWIGAIRALQERTDLAEKEVILVGAGGAARAVAYGLRESGARVRVYNRSAEKARELADEFGLSLGGGLESLDSSTDYDIIINATSVGTPPDMDRSVIPRENLKEGKVIMDIVFFPFTTRLVREAESVGCVAIRGYRMLIHQARFQFKLFTGREPPLKTLEKAMLDAMGMSR